MSVVCEKERKRISMKTREKECVRLCMWETVCVCVCVCVCERERERVRENYVCVRERNVFVREYDV